MVPTHIIGAFCETCDAPYTVAWKETGGVRYRKRMNVEVLVSCNCDGMDVSHPEFIEPEEWI